MSQHQQPCAITINKRHQCIGAEILGIDLSAPMDEATMQIIQQAWLDHLLLIFPAHDISDAEQRATIAGDAPVIPRLIDIAACRAKARSHKHGLRCATRTTRCLTTIDRTINRPGKRLWKNSPY